MPLGAARLTLLAFQATVAAEAQIIRKKVGIQALGNAQLDTAQSYFGGSSAYFDGTNDKLTAKTSEISWGSLTTWTIEFWMRWSSTGVIDSVVGTRTLTNTMSNGEFQFVTLSNNKLQLNVRNTSGTNMTALVSTNTISQNTWHHIAIVRDGNTYELFLDGTSEGSHTLSGDLADKDIFFGEFAENLDYNGYIDEFRLSNTARYTTGFTPSTTPFVNDDNTRCLLHFNGTDGSTFFEDDNGVGRSAVGIQAIGTAQVDTAQSKFGGASALFDGDSDRLTVDTETTITGDFTAEFFIRWNSLTDNFQYPFSTRGGNDPGVIWIENRNTDDLRFNFKNGNDTLRTTDLVNVISTNTWYHYAIQVSNNIVSFYINGVNQLPTSGVSVEWEDAIFLDNSNGILYLGGASFSGSFFHGNIDEFRLSNTARYTSNFTAPSSPFVNDSNTLVLAHMDGASGSTVFRDDNGATRSQVGIQALGNAQTDTAQYKFGGASAYFDGTEDWLQINDNPIPDSGDFTVEFWFRPSSVGTLRPIWSNRDSDGTHRGTLYINTSSQLTWWNASDNVNYLTPTLSVNTWHHIACVQDGSTRRLFLNGDGVSATSSFTPGEIMEIGAAKYTSTAFANELDGHIDEFRVSNTARYTANFTAPTEPFQNDANTVFLSHMDGTDGGTDFIDDNGKES